MDSNGKIDSQEEYDLELFKFNTKLKEFSKLKNLMRPSAYREFGEIINHAEDIGLFSHEYCNEIRQKLIDGVNNPSIKAKVKEVLKKKGWLK